MGGPPKPMQPIRPHSCTTVESDTTSRGVSVPGEDTRGGYAGRQDRVLRVRAQRDSRRRSGERRTAAGGRPRPRRPRGRRRAGRRSASARAGGTCCARVRNRADSQAAPARFTSRTRLSPSAAVRFGVNPRSPIRATIAPSTIRSSTSALTTATSWMPSIQSGRRGRLPRGHAVQDEREDDHAAGRRRR